MHKKTIRKSLSQREHQENITFQLLKSQIQDLRSSLIGNIRRYFSFRNRFRSRIRNHFRDSTRFRKHW